MADPIRCPHCRQRHMPRFLCDPAKQILDDIVARGDSFTMPTVAFDSPMPGGLGPGDVLVRQLVVKGATVPVAGTVHPALILTGQDLAGRLLPSWLFAGSDEQIRGIATLTHDMAELAIRGADRANGTPT